MTRHFRTKLTILFALLAPGTASAQSGPMARPPEPGPGDAIRLEAHAVQLENDRSSWRQAARLYRHAASLRDVSDELALVDRRRAGYLEYYRGAYEEALSDFSTAASMAHETGRVVEAAHDYINGAWAAARMRDFDLARSLLESARKLTYSPLLSAGDRRSVLLRLEVEQEAARAR